MKDLCVVSGADAGFFDLVSEMLGSLRAHPETAGIPARVLDLGLTEAQREALAEQAATAFDPGWDVAVPADTPVHLKAMAARPHLPRHVPGFGTLMWLDADLWVQDPSAVIALAAAARDRGFAAVAEADRAYSPWFGSGSFRDWQRANVEIGYGEALAAKLCELPIINCGVVCARSDAPHWAAWAKALEVSVARAGLRFPTEQAALNAVLWTQGLPFHLLPSRCNWICSRAAPMLAADRRTLVEPCWPHEPLGIVHLTADTKAGERTLDVVGGGTERRSLRWSAVDGSVSAS